VDAKPWYLGATPLATLPWLIRLRWTTAAIEAAVVVAVTSLPHLDLPLAHLSLLLVVSAMNNAAFALWMSRGQALPRPVVALGLLLDMVLLTGLLELTGGPLNPFSVVYVVQIALAALTMGTLWTAGLGVFGAVCYGVLIYWHTHELVPGHHRLNDFPTHLFTIWIAAVVTAELVAHFVVQVSAALVRREAELEAMRLRAARSERLMSLTTLAAGAAHELSTPLATIALASRELELAATARGTVPDLAEDARLIRSEVDRCRAILDQMSGRAGGIAADPPTLVDLPTVIADVRHRLTEDQARRLEVRVPSTLQHVFLPPSGLAQVVLSLVKNAFDATGDAGLPVRLEVSHDSEMLRVSVQDQGPGVSADVLRHAGEPFFTTKEPGRGLGLGLFLARIFAERFGGTVKLRSGDGTIAVLELPLRSPSAEFA
jgi:two-component system sensor histidine kinase RegB